MKLERIFKIYPAFDKRSNDPNKNQGIHGCDMYFSVKGEHGAIQFGIMTNWYLPHVQEEIDQRELTSMSIIFPFLQHKPNSIGIDIHSKKPLYDGQECYTKNCELTGGVCYTGGCFLEGIRIFKEILLPKGSEALWEELERIYKQRFNYEQTN